MVKDIDPMRVICGSCGALYGAGKLATPRWNATAVEDTKPPHPRRVPG